MRKRLGFIAVVLSFALLATPLYAASPKAGASCSKVGATSTYAGKKYTCIKSGSKLVWNKGVVVTQAAAKPSATPTNVPEVKPTPTQAPTPTNVEPIIPKGPSSFEDLFENRKGVSNAAWLKVSQTILKNKSTIGKLDVYTGPNSTATFENYSDAANLISRAVPGNKEPAKVIIVRYQYVDLDWAEKQLRQLVTQDEYDLMNRNEGGRLLTSNCDLVQNFCRGAKALGLPSGVAVILQGIVNDSQRQDFHKTGMLEAHEYFHTIQDQFTLNKNMDQLDWPPLWVIEGSAEWIQNAAINYKEFKSYSTFISADCDERCTRLTEKELNEFLLTSINPANPNGYEAGLNYILGSWFIEILVAIKGQQSILDLWEQSARKIGFPAAFKNVYGVEWSYAVPILAKTVYANLRGN